MSNADSGVRPGRFITRNREHVLETAMNAYWQDDRGAVSVNAVCALAGVSKPLLYREFGSEDGLSAAVLERYGQTVLASLQALLLASPGAPAFRKDDTPLNRTPGGLMERINASLQRGGQG